MKELWKDIDGYGGRYKISNLGRVKIMKRTDVYNKGELKILRIYKEKIVMGTTDYYGYKIVSLYNNHIPKRCRVNRLVAIHFIPNPENKRTVNHINGIRHDNRFENLEWATYSENIKHSYDHLGRKGAWKDKKGDSHPLSMRVAQYNMNDELINIYGSANEAARTIGTWPAGICNCARGKAKQYKGYKWKYVNKD